MLQVIALFPSSTGAPSRGLRRDCLQCMLSVLMNLTHNNAAGTAAVVAAGGLEAAAHVVDSVLGPPEEEALFVRIADRCRDRSCREFQAGLWVWLQDHFTRAPGVHHTFMAVTLHSRPVLWCVLRCASFSV